MIHNIGNCWYIFVMTLFYLSYTYGPLWQESPAIPNDGELKICRDWLLHYGFVNDYDENKTMSFNRTIEFDSIVDVHAATYAYFVSTFSPTYLAHKFLPTEFCQRFNDCDTRIQYKALEDSEMTCGEWIVAYGYYKDNRLLNKNMATYRIVQYDNDTHIWVAMYSRYMKKTTTPEMTPAEFCLKMGKQVTPGPKKLPFLKFDTLKFCEEWIKFSDYTDNVDRNMRKALEQDMEFDEYLGKWTVEYIHYLIDFDKENPQTGCCGSLLRPKPKKPAAFCEWRNGGVTELPVPYEP